MEFPFTFLALLSLICPSTSVTIPTGGIPVIEISDGQIEAVPTKSACSTITTTIGTRVDKIPVPCYDAMSTPTLTEQVMIGSTSAVVIVAPSGDVSILSKPGLLPPGGSFSGTGSGAPSGRPATTTPLSGSAEPTPGSGSDAPTNSAASSIQSSSVGNVAPSSNGQGIPTSSQPPIMTSSHAGTGILTSHAVSQTGPQTGSSSASDSCPSTTPPAPIPGCWGQPACAYYMYESLVSSTLSI